MNKFKLLFADCIYEMIIFSLTAVDVGNGANIEMSESGVQGRDSEETNYQRRHSQETNVTAIEIPGTEIVAAAEISSWIRIKAWLKATKECFNWGDFFFALIFGLAPTAWDMYTDLELANHLLEEENKHAAGLCYVFICLPGINLVKEKVGEAASKLQSRVGVLLAGLIMGLYFLMGTAIFVGLGVLLWHWPLAFRYPAIFITVSIVATKTVAVFLHNPRMKSLSRNMSESEAFFESALQLTLLLHIWLSGGKVNKSTIFSSVLVIGKVGAENLLNDGEQLKGKNFWERLLLILKFIPVMALTAIFRLGSGALVR